MSATMTMTMATLPDLNYLSSASTAAPHSCPKCGFSAASSAPDFPLSPASMSSSSDSDAEAALAEAQQQIQDLQAQVRLLNQKATAAVDRWADYEDELARLRRQVGERHTPHSRGVTLIHSPSNPPSVASPAARTSFLTGTAASRISALLSPRSARSTPNLKNPNTNNPNAVPPTPSTPGFPSTPSTPQQPHAPTARPGSPTPSADELLSALSREQSLRRAAEGKLSDTSREVEELSAQLFEQANEMVAEERRARARLEARVEVLEKRDVEKRARLERLERAMTRIERVRALLGESGMMATGEEGNGSGGGGGNGRIGVALGSGRSSPA